MNDALISLALLNPIIRCCEILGAVLWLPGLVAEAGQSLPIIPGASGFGIGTLAGSGRHLNPPGTRIIKVTNLNTRGPGSLREAIEADGPRVVVFEVSGNIDFRPYGMLVISKPYITIAGQTAPSPRVTMVGCELVVRTHDVLIQHIRVRIGDLKDPGQPEVDPRSGWSQWSERDCMKVGGLILERIEDPWIASHMRIFKWWMGRRIHPERSKVMKPLVLVTGLELKRVTAVRQWVLPNAGA